MAQPSGHTKPLTAVVVLAFVALAWGTAYGVNRMLGGHLDRNLYAPACTNACARTNSRLYSMSAGGRGHRFEMNCRCNGPAVYDWSNARADLSNGGIGDLVLHYGGREVLMVGAFLVIGLAGTVLGWKVQGVKSRP